MVAILDAAPPEGLFLAAEKLKRPPEREASWLGYPGKYLGLVGLAGGRGGSTLGLGGGRDFGPVGLGQG
jgi:hypothetical protein